MGTLIQDIRYWIEVVAQKLRLYGRCHFNVGFGYWSQYGDF